MLLYCCAKLLVTEVEVVYNTVIRRRENQQNETIRHHVRDDPRMPKSCPTKPKICPLMSRVIILLVGVLLYTLWIEQNGHRGGPRYEPCGAKSSGKAQQCRKGLTLNHKQMPAFCPTAGEGFHVGKDWMGTSCRES